MNKELQNKYKGYMLGKTDPQEYFMDEFSAWAIENCQIGNGDMLINVIEDGTTFDNWFRDYHTDLWEADDKWWDEQIKYVREKKRMEAKKEDIGIQIGTIQITGDVSFNGSKGLWFDVNSFVLSDETIHAILEDLAEHYAQHEVTEFKPREDCDMCDAHNGYQCLDHEIQDRDKWIERKRT